MKILLTGGCGFIGHNFVLYWLDKYPNDEILNIDKLTYASNEGYKSIKVPRYSFVHSDLSNIYHLHKIILNFSPDIVLHFAAESHVDNSITTPVLFTEQNVLQTHILLEAWRKYYEKTKKSKFIYISTDEVYGSGGPFSEENSLNPSSPYSASKASAELICKSYYKTYGVPVLITRSSNNYGPFQHIEKLIPKFITNLLRNHKVPLYAQGENMRDWIYVTDNCRAIERVIFTGRIGESYNIGSGNLLTNKKITYLLLSKLGKDESLIQLVPDRLGHDFKYALNTKKLGFIPTVSFDEGIDKTIEWYKDERNYSCWRDRE